MQQSIWLLAYLLHCLPWSGSLVDGAAVLLTSPPSSSILHPPRLDNQSHAIVPEDFSIVTKDRGSEIPAARLLQAGLGVIVTDLAPGDYHGFITSQTWTSTSIVLVMATTDQVQRAFVIQGIYALFLWMKSENDFRSGDFRIRYLNTSIFDLDIHPAGSSELENQPNLAHITQIPHSPPPLLLNISNTAISSKSVASVSRELVQIGVFPFLPLEPLDPLGMLISLVHLAVTAAEPASDQLLQGNSESTVPFSGVKISILLAIDIQPAYVLTYNNVLTATLLIAQTVTGGDPWAKGALRVELFTSAFICSALVLLEPSDSPTRTSGLIGATVTASADSATAKEKRSMAHDLWDAGRS